MRTLISALLVVAVGACGGGAAAPPLSLDYPAGELGLRVGDPLPPFAPMAAELPAGAAFSVEPPLPSGLLLDPATGSITGSPVAPSSEGVYRISVRVGAAAAAADLLLWVDPALPVEFSSLAPGWSAELLVDNAAEPVRVAAAPDGRLFYAERRTGQLRVVDSDGRLEPTPVATLPVLNDGHRGLLGLALAPDFAQRPQLFVAACTPADQGSPERLRVLRFDLVDGRGTNQTVILDVAPLTGVAINVGGELAFDSTGHLLVGVGDLQAPALAQDPASPAGKLLRITRDGAIPSDNPDPTSRVYCRGFRNPFALAVHAGGSIFAADNGPETDDRLAFAQPGRDFGWGATSPPAGVGAGYEVRTWPEVVVPTALCLLGDDLLITTYADGAVLQLRMSGPARTDIDEERVLATFRDEGYANKPLCVRAGVGDGEVYVSTFRAIWRLRAR